MNISFTQCLVIGLLLLFFLFVFSGCTVLSTTSAFQASDDSSGLKFDLCLEFVASTGSFSLYREKVTDVLYLMRTTNVSSASGVGFTVMYHPDGSPLLYSEWIEMFEDE